MLASSDPIITHFRISAGKRTERTPGIFKYFTPTRFQGNFNDPYEIVLISQLRTLTWKALGRLLWSPRREWFQWSIVFVELKKIRDALDLLAWPLFNCCYTVFFMWVRVVFLLRLRIDYRHIEFSIVFQTDGKQLETTEEARTRISWKLIRKRTEHQHVNR